MKKIIPFLILAFLVFACQENNLVIISGKIINPVDEPTGVRINYLQRNDTITVNPDGTFYAEIELNEEHLAWFDHGHYSIPLYLIPGAKIKMEFDAKESEGWSYTDAKISGKKSKHSAFLYALDLDLNQPSREELAKMKVDSFSTIMNNLDHSTSTDIEKFISKKSPSDLFAERIWLKQKSELATKYLEFIRYNKYPLSNEKSAYNSFQEFINTIPTNDVENCKEITEYWYFLYQYNEDRINNIMKESGLYKETKAYINKLADEIIALDVPQEIKDDIGRWHFSVFYKRPDSLRQVYRARYSDVVKNKKYIEELEKIEEKQNKLDNILASGKVAPSFNYPDINGQMVSLESFKGKVVYVDVWATWCGPCKAEIPYLISLEKELHEEDIVFISVSMDDNKSAWEKMVKEKNLKTNQLYATGGRESKIVEDYNIQGIPYFIIIDKEGKLVEVNASHPSNPETKEKLLKLAQS